MAIVNGRLGTAAATLGAYVSGTRMWAGGTATYDGTENFDVAAGNTVTAENNSIVCTRLGPTAHSNSAGAFNFKNVDIFDAVGGADAEASQHNSFTFEDVTWNFTNLTRTLNVGKWQGATTNRPVYNLNGLNVYGNISSTDSTLAFIVFFPASTHIDPSSVLSGISLWNGLTGESAAGGVLSLGYSTFSGLVSGPFGSRPFYEGSGVGRLLYRCAIGGAASTNRANLLSYDYRAIHGAQGANGQWRFAHDFTGNAFLVNPLVGTPGGTGSIKFVNGTTQFSNTSCEIDVLIGHQPATTSGDIKFVNADTSKIMWSMPSAYSATSYPTAVSSNIITHAGGAGLADNGLGFEIQSFTLVPTNNVFNSTGADGPGLETAEVPTACSYRTYSWQQEDFNTTRTITPTVAGATDVQRDADRASGNYPLITATGPATTFDINEDADPITAEYSTVAAAQVLKTATNVNTARRAIAAVKLLEYETVTTTSRALPYTRSGSVVTGAGEISLTSAGGLATQVAGNNFNVRVASFDVTDEVTEVIATGTFTISSSGLMSSVTEKAIISSTTLVDLNISTQTYRQCTFDTPAIADLSVNATFEGLLLNPTGSTNSTMSVGIVGATANSTHTLESLLGDDFTSASFGGTLVLTSDAAISVGTNIAGITGGTGVTIVAPPSVNTVSIPAPASGFYAVRQTIGGVETQRTGITSITSGTPITFDIDSGTFSDGDFVDVYVKYNSSLATGANAIYQESVQRLMFNTTDGTILNFTNTAPTADALVGLGVDPLTGTSFINSIDSNSDLLVTLNNTVNNNPLNVPTVQALGLAALVSNGETYFRAWYDNRAVTADPILSYNQGNLVGWDVRRVTFASNNVANTFRIQHTVNNWQFRNTSGETSTLARTGAGEVAVVIATLALVNPADIAVGVDLSQTYTEVRRLQQNEKTKPGPLAGTTTFPNQLTT